MAGPIPRSRREFLSGRPIASAVSELAGQSGLLEGLSGSAPAAAHPRTRSGSLITVSRRAMACLFEVAVPALFPEAVDAAAAALDEIEQLEDQMTVYRDDSELSRINLLAAATPLPVEERLFHLLQTALRLHRETAGAFDIAAGALVKAWGFFRGPKRVPGPTELAKVLQVVGSRYVTLDPDRKTIAFERPGVELNLGAIGKGYALDRAAELLRQQWGISSAMLHGGLSSVYALGPSTDPWHGHRGWLVGIRHPFQPERRVAQAYLCDMALGTSGSSQQCFAGEGRRFGHILDPRTGWPAAERDCVSVIAPTAAEADALSTALFILGPEQVREYCERHPEIGAVLVRCNPQSDLEIELLGLARQLVVIENPTVATSNP
jgi:thiamine biosynthesis lipoprotein